MYSARDDAALPAPGFPIRESAGQSLFSSSPRLIAAVHALHRLLMPRHPPCALTILTVIVDRPAGARLRTPAGFTTVIFHAAAQASLRCGDLFGQLCSFQGPGRAQPRGLPGWSLKTQQCTAASAVAEDERPGPVDISGRRVAMWPARRARPYDELPRKEVIQP